MVQAQIYMYYGQTSVNIDGQSECPYTCNYGQPCSMQQMYGQNLGRNHGFDDVMYVTCSP